MLWLAPRASIRHYTVCHISDFRFYVKSTYFTPSIHQNARFLIHIHIIYTEKCIFSYFHHCARSYILHCKKTMLFYMYNIHMYSYVPYPYSYVPIFTGWHQTMRTKQYPKVVTHHKPMEGLLSQPIVWESCNHHVNYWFYYSCNKQIHKLIHLWLPWPALLWSWLTGVLPAMHYEVAGQCLAKKMR